jgi:hypothetical protein
VVELEEADVERGMMLDVRRSVLRAVRQPFRFECRGIHGVAHWARAAEECGVDGQPKV